MGAQQIGQRLAFDIFQRQEVVAVGGAGVERTHDVGVAQTRGAFALALEALQVAFVVRQVRRQHLERHHRPRARIHGAIDHGHAAAPDFRLDAIGADLLGCGNHRTNILYITVAICRITIPALAIL